MSDLKLVGPWEMKEGAYLVALMVAHLVGVMADQSVELVLTMVD